MRCVIVMPIHLLLVFFSFFYPSLVHINAKLNDNTIDVKVRRGKVQKVAEGYWG